MHNYLYTATMNLVLLLQTFYFQNRDKCPTHMHALF